VIIAARTIIMYTIASSLARNWRPGNKNPTSLLSIIPTNSKAMATGGICRNPIMILPVTSSAQATMAQTPAAANSPIITERPVIRALVISVEGWFTGAGCWATQLIAPRVNNCERQREKVRQVVYVKDTTGVNRASCEAGLWWFGEVVVVMSPRACRGIREQ